MPFSIVFTKADKLGTQRQRENVERYLAKLREQWEELPPHFVTSSEKGVGRAELLGYIDEHEEVCHLLALEDVCLDDLRELVLCLLTTLGVAISWEVHQVPRIVDDKVIDEHRLTRCGRCHGQLGLAGEHIDEARLTYIRSTDKCILRLPVLGAFVQTGITYDKLCALYLHVYILFTDLLRLQK